MCPIRRSLLCGGHDPSTAAGRMAFLRMDPYEQARYLHDIEYLEDDVDCLLGLLDGPQRALVLDLVDRDHERWEP